MQILVTGEVVEYKNRFNTQVKLYIRRGLIKDIIIYERTVIAKRYFGFLWTRSPSDSNYFLYGENNRIKSLLD